MGNEQSHLSGIRIEEKSVEVSDFWSHHSASITNLENTTHLSVLTGELFVDGALWKNQTPLEKNSRNLMIYRHPCIVKYISSWHKSSKFYLAIEEVIPLSHVLHLQNTLQICIGLHSILKALCFLHETAKISHNNICTASIYTTKDGNWKLGSMEYACKFTELTPDYLMKSKNNRYNKAVDSNEEKHLTSPDSRKDIIDVYAFGVLVCEVLKNKTDDDIPSLSSFVSLCKTSLQDFKAEQRPKLATLLEHDFFNHEFISIHSFLVELPLKSDEIKTEFFQSLVERLRTFPELTVANQLTNLLLSRMVLLNKTAQEEVLPFVLRVKDDSEDASLRLFSEETFKKYLVPKLLEIFGVRDAQIRLLLLNYFKDFVQMFAKEELQSCILPELLVGVKDTNDGLVAATLRTLAELVPILGAAVVIGGKRAKLFNDGRPIVHPSRRTRRVSSAKPRRELPVAIPQDIEINPIVQTHQLIMELPERPRPDGEEGETSAEEIEAVEEDLDNWEDWDVSENTVAGSPPVENNIESSSNSTEESVVSVVFEQQEIGSISSGIGNRKKSLPDISELDIKSQARVEHSEEFDFFQDMEPVIEASAKFLVEENTNSGLCSKLNVTSMDEISGEGWVDEEWD